MLREQGRLDEAVACFRDALDRSPDFVEAHYNLGVALAERGRPDEAAVCYRRTLELRPGFAEAHNNLGNLLRGQGRLDEAIACFRRTLDLRPDLPGGHISLGNALKEQGRLDEAVACYRRALDLQPDFAEGHYYLAMSLLARGEMAAGWEEFEWRWKTPAMIHARRNFAQPQWRGEPAPGRTLLIHPEGGFGDTLQFCRYARLAAERGLRVILEVPTPLVRLLQTLAEVDRVVAKGEDLPAFDLHCPMLSLPLALKTTLETIPGTTPYLRADPLQVASWQARMAAMENKGFRVGLVWAGNPRYEYNRNRSLAPDVLAPLFGVPGTHFVSLQKDGPAAPAHLPLTDVMEEIKDFADTAALIANLDLVMSVDTAVVHLAAALGKPVWLLDRFDPDWRWLTGRRDSPWYPTLRIYRQQQPGDWVSVIADIARDLHSAPERIA